jgi:hypothetical protein
MAGTRTAPTVGALTATTLGATLHLIDASGDVKTDYIAGGTSDLADVEAWAAAYQPTTQASLWKVSFTQEWEGEADPQNAEALFRGGIDNGINLLFKDIAASAKQTPRVYSPVAAVMQGNQDIPLLSAAIMTTLLTQYLTMLGGAYALDSAQFTGRRERANNPRIRV